MQEQDIKQLVKIAYQAIDDKKGTAIRILDIHDVTVIADYFLIASADNRNLLQAMAEEVEERLGRAGYQCRSIEGNGASGWALLDYGSVVIHLFDSENRLFYDLERIWRDGKQMDIEDLGE